jgi:stage II sporulation protein D
MKFLIVLLTLTLYFTKYSFSENVHVELFSKYDIQTLMFSPIEGKYDFITNNGKISKIKKNDIIYLTLMKDSISVWSLNENLGTVKWIEMRGVSKFNTFKIEPTYPISKARSYEGDLKIYSDSIEFHIENDVPVNTYLAGVVEAEAGPNAPYEFYKAQAIISRTYLFEFINREGVDDYIITDDVSHQVYKGLELKNPVIKQAVTNTNNLVITDSSNQLITASFYSNSGGYTANSEDVWVTKKDYLRSISDPFSLNQKNTYWKDSILTSDWLTYLEVNGIDISSDSAKIDNLFFTQEKREKYYCYKGDSIPLKQIRKDFKFKSTWFSIEPKGNYLIVKGKGYGHAVGLSQEGAMQMARQNYSFVDIINYYYKNVKIVNYETIR